MIKYFHELTKAEFKELQKSHMTWKECAEKYPQPKWCNCSDAVMGEWGCWSLVDFLVTGEDYCRTCEMYTAIAPPPTAATIKSSSDK